MKQMYLTIILLTIGKMSFSQNVGIGTTTPISTLDVVGTVKITDGTEGIGKVFTSNRFGQGSWQSLQSHSDFKNRVVVTSSRDFIIPADVTKIFVEMWGGGGNGSTANQPATGGGGGGGGGYANFYLAVTVGNTATLVVAPSAHAVPVNSKFTYDGNDVTVNDGGNGDINNPGFGGSVLVTGINDVLQIEGEDGYDNLNGNFSIGAVSYIRYSGGKGGSSPNGGQGGHGKEIIIGNSVAFNNVGKDGKFPGGGAGANVGNGNAYVGAAGVIVIYY